MDNRIIIIDGNSLINRAYYAINRPMITKDGIYTQGIFGFLNMMKKLDKTYPSGYMLIAFDKKGPTFRNEMYDDYKAGRKRMPPELAMEIPLLKEILDAMNISRIEKDGYEADDLIGTMARRAEEKGLEPLVITGDKDELQLVTAKTKVVITRKGISEFDLYDEKTFFDKYGFTPDQFVDFKGLMGDPSDNYPGIPGVGEKSATKLILEYGSVEGLYENIDKLPENKMKQNIIDNRSLAFMSRELAAIITDVPVDMDIEDCKRTGPDEEKLLEIYKKLEFNSFIKEMRITASGHEKKTASEVSGQELAGLLDGKTEITLKLVTDASHTQKPSCEGAYFISDGNLYLTKSVEDLAHILEDLHISVAGHDTVNDLYVLRSYADDIRVSFDTAVCEYILDPAKSSYAIKNLALDYLNRDVADDDTGEICCASADIRIHQEKRLEEEGLFDVFHDIELPLIPVLADMEYAGIRCDKNVLRDIGAELDGRIQKLTADIYGHAGKEFNINSTKQLGTVLFEDLGLPPVKKTKTGYSTGADVLEKLKDKHPIIEEILEYRGLTKLKSTYVDGLVPTIDADEDIHAHFRQTVAATGRLSCTEPNLQNIPLHTEEGRRIRLAFVPHEGNVFVGADYSQIELRVLAHMAEDEELIDAFNRGDDIHRLTASKVFNIPFEEVDPEIRSRAKAVNFGVIYGMSGFGLSEELSISPGDADEYIKEYFNKYSSVKVFMDGQISSCRERGYVTTLSGRKRYINEIKDRNFNVRRLGERLAMNTPIQGTAADIIKIAMVKVHEALKDYDAKLVLQIHDELIIEAPEREVDDIKELLRTSMESAFEMKVKLAVEVNTGTSWYDLK